MVINKNNMREVDGVTHHISIFSWGEKGSSLVHGAKDGLLIVCQLFQIDVMHPLLLSNVCCHFLHATCTAL